MNLCSIAGMAALLGESVLLILAEDCTDEVGRSKAAMLDEAQAMTKEQLRAAMAKWRLEVSPGLV